MRALFILLALLAVSACAVRQPAPGERSAAGAKPAAAPVSRPVIQPSTDGTYTVKKGDTLYSIALEHGADYREVAQWNGLTDPTKIDVGQRLRVSPPAGAASVAPVRGGAAPEARPLEKPQAAAVAKAPEPARADDAIQFIWPARGKVIAGFTQPRSKGIDIDGKLGDPVVAAAAGRVTYIGSGIPGLGKLVVIKHDAGFITVYAHNREILVKEQQAVSRGQKIAEIGATDSDRPKLHFQIRKGSSPVDPLRYLPSS
jgi:murein DD-endopeptidase MepM/ murein hydrolase activator NlpD